MEPVSLTVSFGILPPGPVADRMTCDDPAFELHPVRGEDVARVLVDELEFISIPPSLDFPIHRFASPDKSFELGYLQAGDEVRSIHADAFGEVVSKSLVELAAHLERDMLVSKRGAKIGACLGYREPLHDVHPRFVAMLHPPQDAPPVQRSVPDPPERHDPNRDASDAFLAPDPSVLEAIGVEPKPTPSSSSVRIPTHVRDSDDEELQLDDDLPAPPPPSFTEVPRLNDEPDWQLPDVEPPRPPPSSEHPAPVPAPPMTGEPPIHERSDEWEIGSNKRPPQRHTIRPFDSSDVAFRTTEPPVRDDEPVRASGDDLTLDSGDDLTLDSGDDLTLDSGDDLKND